MFLLAKISPVMIINIILVLIILWMVGNQLYLFIQRKRVATMLTEEKFRENMRKAQIIDVREKKEFDAGHILGARNIPYSVFKTRLGEIRTDIPVYLYDQNKTLSTRAAIVLHKNGYDNLFWLKGGYQGWTGKTKSKH